MRHLFPTDRIAGLLDAERGLTAEEVEERRRYGGNDSVSTSGDTDVKRMDKPKLLRTTPRGRSRDRARSLA